VPGSGIGRVAENDEDGHIALDVLGGVAFCFQFRKEQVLLGASGRCPTGKGVGQVDTGALIGAIREWCGQCLQQQAELQMGHDKGRRQEFKAEDTFHRRPFQVIAQQRIAALLS
jgi:hypothetical protein